MTKSNTKIEEQLKRKRSSELVETIIFGKKKSPWKEVTRVLSGPTKARTNVNIDKLSKMAKQGEVLVVPGKVLSLGEIDKKIRVVALSFSEKAKEKLNKAGCETLTILEEIKKNPEAKDIRIIR